MINRKILVIDELREDIELLQHSVSRLDSGFTLRTALNPKEALAILMGGNNSYAANQSNNITKPEAILLHFNYLKADGADFLEVINKYYSLKNIKVFVIGEAQDKNHPILLQHKNISGFIPKPFDLNAVVTNSSWHKNEATVVKGKVMLAGSFLFLKEKFSAAIQFFKYKSIVMPSAQLFTTKVALGTASAIMAVSMVAVSAGTSEPSHKEQAHQQSPVLKPVKPQPLAEEASPVVPEITVAAVQPIQKTPQKASQQLSEINIQPVAEIMPIPALASRTLKIVAVEESEEVASE